MLSHLAQREEHGGNGHVSSTAPGPNITTSHHRTLISSYIPPQRRFYTPANSMIWRYTKRSTSGLLKSTTRQDKHSQFEERERARERQRPSLSLHHAHPNLCHLKRMILFQDLSEKLWYFNATCVVWRS